MEVKSEQYLICELFLATNCEIAVGLVASLHPKSRNLFITDLLTDGVSGLTSPEVVTQSLMNTKTTVTKTMRISS